MPPRPLGQNPAGAIVFLYIYMSNYSRILIDSYWWSIGGQTHKWRHRFHVAVRLFSNRSQMTSKCGKNISNTLGYRSKEFLLHVPHSKKNYQDETFCCQLHGSCLTKIFGYDVSMISLQRSLFNYILITWK